MGRTTVLALAGAKGGVGKTTTSINLSTVLARTGKSTLFVELDLATANVVDSLRLDATPGQNGDASLHDVLAGRVDVEEAIYSSPDGPDVMPCSTDLDDFATADPERLPQVFERLRGQYDVVVVDTPAGLGRPMVHAASHADATVLVSTLRLASVRDVEKTRDFADRLGSDVIGVIFIGPETKRSPPTKKIAAYLDVELLGHVPHDHAVPTAQDIRRPVVECQPGSVAAETYRAIGSDLYERIFIDRTVGPDESDEPLERAGGGPGGFEFVDDDDDDDDDDQPPAEEDLVLTVDDEDDDSEDADATEGDEAPSAETPEEDLVLTVDEDDEDDDADGVVDTADGDAAAKERPDADDATAPVGDDDAGPVSSAATNGDAETSEDLVLNLDDADDEDDAQSAATQSTDAEPTPGDSADRVESAPSRPDDGTGRSTPAAENGKTDPVEDLELKIDDEDDEEDEDDSDRTHELNSAVGHHFDD